MKYEKTKEDLYKEMEDQIHFLRQSAAAYDKGEIREAKRLANYIYILLHDGTGRTKSLLRQLGFRSKISFISTSLRSPSDKGVWLPLSPPLTASQATPDGFKFVPHCHWANDGYPEWSVRMPFEKWWSESVANQGKRALSRKGLIWVIRSQDGGAHVDTAVSVEPYIELIRDPLPEQVEVSNSEGKVYTPPNAHWATVRQIAWEFDTALKEYGL